MKKMVPIILMAIFVLSSSVMASPRMPLGEMFTNTSCNPCYYPELYLDALMENYANDFSLIRYHVWWPSPGDPFYQFNQGESATRNNYFGNNYTPHLFIDGIVDGGSSYGQWENLYLQRWDVQSPMEIVVTGNYDDQKRETDLNIAVTATDDISSSNLRLFCVLIENYINFHAPNGISVHNQTMRDMVPNATGEVFTISNGETVEFTRQVALDQEFDENNCQIVVFVEDYSTKEIFQTTRVEATISSTGVNDFPQGDIPKTTILAQNYPNPFNAQTNIAFYLKSKSDVNLSVFNLVGQKVAELANDQFDAGAHSVNWDASQVSSGIYFYRLVANGEIKTRRMVLAK